MTKTFLLLFFAVMTASIYGQTYPGTPVSNPVRTYTQNDTKGVWVIGNGAPIFSPTAKMSQLYFDYMNQTGYFWNGSAWVAWTNDFLRTASNGLTEDGTDVKLGGTLTEPTTIDLDGNDFIIQGAGTMGFDIIGDIALISKGGVEIRPDSKFEVHTLGNIEVNAAQDIDINTDDVINIQAVNGGSIIVDNNDFALTATTGDIKLNSTAITAGEVNGIFTKTSIGNDVGVTSYGVQQTAVAGDDGKVMTYDFATNELLLQPATGGTSTWDILGNGGTTQSTNFVGTTDAIGLSLRTNNSIRQTILSTGEVGIGTISPTKRLSVAESTAVTNSIVDIATFDLNTSGTAATGLGVQNIYRVEDPGGSLLEAAGIAGILNEAPTPDGGALLLRAGAGGALSTIMSVYGTGLVGINTTTTPNDYLQIVAHTGTSTAGMTIDKYDGSIINSPANLTLMRSYGSPTTPLTIATGAVLGRINFQGYEGTSKLTMASIYAEATGTIGTNRVPTNMVFNTATDAAPSVLTERMRINSEGSISLPSSGLAASLPMLTMTGAWYASGTATTSKPHLLVEPTGTTSTGWSAVGTGIGVNAASGFVGNLIDLQLAGVSSFKVNRSGEMVASKSITVGTSASSPGMFPITTTPGTYNSTGTNLYLTSSTSSQAATAGAFRISGSTFSHTSSTQYFTYITSGFSAGAGSANYRPFAVEYTINNSGVQSGTATGIFVNATETALNSMAHNLIDLQVGGASRFKVASNGVATIGDITTSSITASSNVILTGTPAGTSGTTNAISITRSYLPTSGTGVFNAFAWTGTINQTGGANGITRCIYINPTLTAAADFRSIDVARGRATFAGRLETGKGANVASSGTLTLGDDGNVFHITGTTTITAITTTNWQAGSEITLIFDAASGMTDGGTLKLNGNLTAAADTVIKLVYDGTNWYEISRSVN